MRQIVGIFSLGLLLAGCEKEDSLNVLTDPPSVTITNPAEGAHVDQGVEMLILGLVDDAKFDEDALAPVWSIDGEAVCVGAVVDAGGATQCTHAFSDVGDAAITLTATNPDGQAGTATITLVVDVNGPPQAEIVAPTPEGIYYSDQPILFEGLVSDAEDPGDALGVVWTSSLDGDLGFDGTPTSAGETSGFTTLSQGEHLISLDVSDSTGRTGEDVTTVVVGPPNSPPDCLIAAPLTGDVFSSNDTILFEAVATDVDVPTSMLTVSWQSDKDGPLGSSTPSTSGDVFFATSDLTVATHTITFTVIDEVGASCVDVVLITIGDGPEIALVTPVDGDVYNEGAAITFEGSVYDGQDLPTAIDLLWESSIDGVISTSRANSSGVARFTDGTLTRGDHTLTLTGTDTDGFTGVDVRTFRVNGLPGAPDIEITPDPPASDDDLRADLVTDAVDPESDAVTYAYVWYRNSSVTTYTSDTVPESATSRGDSWRVVVTASDPYGAGDSDSDTVIVGNGAPELANAVLTPDPATEASTFTCAPGSAVDPDGDSVTYSYAWQVNGASVAVTSNKLTNTYFSRGDDVECVVTPTDGTTPGSAVTSNLVTVGNSLPTVASAALTPTAAYESSTLTCAPGSTADLDGDTVTLAYSWNVSGATIAATTSTLDGSWFSKGDTVTCTVTPDDGTGSGAGLASNTVTIANSIPTVSSATLTPTSATESSTLACGYSGGADGDGDAITYTIGWKIDGSTIAATTTSLTGAYFSSGDDVECTVTPNDGTVSGTTVTSNTVTIGNTKPSAVSVAIAPTLAYTNTDLTAAVSGWADADGDAEGYLWQWYKGSTAITGATTSALSSAEFVRGDKISVAATPWDGTDSGTAVTSAVLTITNAVPSGAKATLAPTLAYEATTLTCTPSAATDVDGDAISYTQTWEVNGSTVSPTGTTLTGTYFDKGDTVTCTVTPTDGTATGTAVTSNTVTILNTAPSLDKATLTPTTAYESSTLSCAKGVGTDADGDSISYAYAWKVNGSTIAPTTTTLTGTYFGSGDDVLCTVTPSDGTVSGTAVTSNTVTIGNAKPSATSVAISPTTAYTNTDLTAAVTGWADADGDAEGYLWQWYKGAVAITGATTSALSSAEFVKGDKISVVATPWDGTDTGSAVTSAVLTISNAAPSGAKASLTPTTAYEGTTLTCTPSGASDVDGDAVTYTQTWSVNGVTVSPTGTTLTGTYFNKADTVMCSVTPTDGTASGTAVDSNTITISNTAPSVDAATLTPTTAYETTTLACAKGLGTDADGDGISYGYSWEVNGATISPTTTTLTGTYFKKADIVTCLVTPTDFTTAGAAVESNAVTILNSPPYGTGVTISPSAVTTDADVLAIPAGGADDDGDTVTWVYQWYKNGLALSGSTAIGLDDTMYVKNDVLYVTATPYDGKSYGATLTSATLTVSNSAPTAPVVLVTPSDAEPADILYCTLTSVSTDADGDTISYTYAWTKNGSPTTITTTSVAASYTSDGDTWACTVTPSDGTTTGASGTDAQTVVDATAPDRPIISAIDRYRNEKTVTLTGTAEAGSELTIYAVCTTGSTSYVTTVSATGTWTYDVSVAAGADCDFYAYAEDSGGNVSPKSNVVETEVCDPADTYEDSSTYGDTCTDSVDEWVTLPDTGSTTISVTGNILDSADADWIVVRTSQSMLTSGTNYYHFEVGLVTGTADYAFTVYDGSCASGALECATAGYTEYEEYAQDVGDSGHAIPSETRACASSSSSRNTCDNLSGTYYIHVFRTTAAYNCNEYVLNVTNGVWP